MLRRWIAVGSLAVLSLLGTLDTGRAEFFGEFSAGPEGEFIDAQPRPLFKLKKEFKFIDPNGLEWIVPTGAEVDGASIPQTFWSFIGGPFSGAYLKASVVHDHFCATRERTAHDTHRDFYYGMRANGVDPWKASLMYWAVETFGPSWTIEKRVVIERICSSRGPLMTCKAMPRIEQVKVVADGPDLSDPEVLSIALAKFASVARTLKTSHGASLDVGPAGVVQASHQSIEDNAATLRGALTAKTYRTDPAILGVLSEVKTGPVDDIAEWSNGQLPTYSKTPSLQVIDPGQPGQSEFRLAPGDLSIIEKQIDLAPQVFDFGLGSSPN
jgi:hypothetical protein